MQATCRPDTELDTALLITVVGDLDAAGAPRLWEVASAEASEEKPLLLIDLRQVVLMTSAGIGTLVRLLSRVRTFGGGVSLFGCNRAVRAAIRIVMLEKILEVCDTLEEARNRLRG